MEEIKRGHYGILAICGLLIIIVLSGGMLFGKAPHLFDFLTNQSGSADTQIASNLLQDGDFKAAANTARRALSDAQTPEMQDAARSVLAYALTMSGANEDRAELAQLLKDKYERATTDTARVSVLNGLLELATIHRDQEMMRTLFEAGPFKEFYVKGEYTTTLKNVAERSAALYPTTIAYWYQAQWHTVRIKGDASAMDREHADTALSLIAKAEALQEKEVASMEGEPLSALYPMRYYFWRSYLYGSVARVYPEYLQRVKESREAGIAHYESVRKTDGGQSAILEVRVPYLDFMYALALYNVEKEKGYPEVRTTLNHFIATIEANPALHERGYIAIIKRVASGTSLINNAEYANLKRLALVSPEFNAFLKKQGLEIQ